jgi:hypothetical protein
MTELRGTSNADRRLSTGREHAWWRLDVAEAYVLARLTPDGATLEVGVGPKVIAEEPAHSIELGPEEARSLGRFLAGGSP